MMRLIEVIERLNLMQERCCNGYDAEALTLAIKALEERPQGKWEFGYTADNGLDEIIRCSVCHRFDTAKYIDGRNSYYDYPAFCKYCGADMKGDKE